MRSQERHRRRSTWATALIGPVFLLTAGWCLWGPEFLDLPQRVPPPIEPTLLSRDPPRTILSDPPAIEINGSRRTCMDCHRLFEPAEHAPADLTLHKGITLNHGINDRCLNCHDVHNRNKLVLHDGTLVSYAQSPFLCAKCHGPTYRDWERGAHGRTNGYWDASSGEVRRLKCLECHDPHSPRVPAMVPIAPLPGPRHWPYRSGGEVDHRSGEVAGEQRPGGEPATGGGP